MKRCDTKNTSKCNKHGRYRVQPGWTHKWTSPKETHVREVVRGPFFSPKLLKTSPFVTFSLHKSQGTKYDRSIVRNGIPDPWTESLALKGTYGLVNKRALEKCRVPSTWRLHVTEKMWQKFGVPLVQGIPDPLRNLSISQTIQPARKKHLDKLLHKLKKEKVKSEDPMEITENIDKDSLECEKKVPSPRIECKHKRFVPKVDKSTVTRLETKSQSRKDSPMSLKMICENCNRRYLKVMPHRTTKLQDKETETETKKQNHCSKCDKSQQAQAQVHDDGTMCLKSEMVEAKPRMKKASGTRTELESQNHCPKCKKLQHRVEQNDHTSCVKSKVTKDESYSKEISEQDRSAKERLAYNERKNEAKTVCTNKSDFENAMISLQGAGKRTKLKRKNAKDDRRRETDSGELADISRAESMSHDGEVLTVPSAMLLDRLNVLDLKKTVEQSVSNKSTSDTKVETRKCNSMQSFSSNEVECESTKLEEKLQKSKVYSKNNVQPKHCYLRYCNPHFKSQYSSNSVSDVSCKNY